jgi:prefoldin subunit 5
MIVLAPISVGELIDKITILEIKVENITDFDKNDNITRELRTLIGILEGLEGLPNLQSLSQQLSMINLELWRIEDAKRECERNQSFDEHFIHLARQVYIKNDVRAQIKREINMLCGSYIVEEKSYKK